MKKIFFTCVFAALSTVWTLSEAACLPPLPQVINTSIEGISGTLQWLPYPCIEGEVCPTCLSAAIVSVSGDSTYYLSSHNQEVQDFLEYLDQIPVPAIYQLPLRASACGALYHRDDYACLDINNLAGLYVEYFSDHYQHKGIPSLCDEWHMVVPSFDQISPGRTYMHRILKDTLINGQQYKMLESNESGSFTYDGAMREDAARIYFVPEGSAHEYLLYDFNAQVGQTLTNLWIGGLESEYNQISSVTVDRIEGIAPSRNFVLTYLYQGEYLLYFNWIEGVGMASGPAGWGAFPGEPVDPTPELLCAYKNGEQVYVSNYGEQYGCDYSSYFPMGMQWETVSPYSDNSCIVHGDTTINGMSYRIIVGKDKFIIPIRQEAKKIYAHLNDSDYLFYDFGLNVGDTISTFFEYDEEKGIHVSERPARVEAIETTTLLDGRVAKLFVYDRNRDPDIEYVGNLDFGVLMPFYTQQAFIPENLPGFCCSRYGRPVYGRCSRENENNNYI